MKPYLALLQRILDKDRKSNDRTGTGTIKVAGEMMKFDLMRGGVKILPAVTTKKLYFNSVVTELLWFRDGETNAMLLIAQNNKIWNQWMLPDGDLGPVYGHTWRHAPAGDYFKNMSNNELLEYIAMMAPDQRAIYDREIYDHTFKRHQLNTAREWLTKMGIDQLSQALHKLKTNPNDRRIIVDAWTPQYVPIDKGADMAGLSQAEVSQLNVRRGRAALAYCHVLYQFLTEELTTDERMALVPKREWGKNSALHGSGLSMPSILALSHVYVDALKAGTIADEDIPKDHEGNPNNSVDTVAMLDALKIPKFKLNCVVYQRSADSFLGVAFNVASYGLLTHMVAQVSGMLPGELTWMGGDVHLYRNHLDGVREQLSREPYPAPELYLNPEITNLFAFTKDDISLVNYQHHPAIKGEIAV